MTTKAGDAPRKETKTKAAAQAPVERQPASASEHAFPVIGLGASAGGLEALDSFLSRVPADSGMAFIVVQHLDPTQKGLLPELLQRGTRMTVSQAGNRMKVKPNCVYVIPPNKDLSILHGALHLLDPSAPRGLRLPIDYFFRALAEDMRERAIGVILSGMGSDGTLGARAIKEKGGLVMVQEPSTAKFDSMPKSAIGAGMADLVAAPEVLPTHILECLRRVSGTSIGIAPQESESAAQKSALEKIVLLLRERTGHDFSLYKKSTLYRRIERRIGIHQIDRISDYVRYLRESPGEIDLLFNELLIGVTSFFRDPASWEKMQKEAIPALLESGASGRPMRAWVAGCSTGEEAYSLAIAFREVLDELKPPVRNALQIFATDLDPAAIERARAGRYPPNIVADISPERLARYFVEEEPGYRVGKEIREMVVFATQNLIMDPPFTKLDILCCRNLLIYLGPELQQRLLPLFHYSLNPGGVLFLGSAESIGGFNELFIPLDAKSRLFRRSGAVSELIGVTFPSRPLSPMTNPREGSDNVSGNVNVKNLAEGLLLQQFAPAAVLVNGDGDIVYISGRTGRYLEPAAGKANMNVYAMAREGLQQELALALSSAMRHREVVTRRGIRIHSDDDVRTIDLTVQPITDQSLPNNIALIVFADVPTVATGVAPTKRGQRTSPRVKELENALQQALQDVQGLREETQSSQEELKSSNEELQSTNEELQSTNEELTTSKEEMQSLNEELQTVNMELQAKVDDLTTVNSDMKNLLDSTDIATVFLDNALHVRRFTPQATRMFKLIPADTGRALADIVTDLLYPELHNDAREVLRTLAFCEKEVATADGRWFTVKIMPYRTLDNVIDGVVLTCTNITQAKRLEAELRKRQSAVPDGAGGNGEART